MKIIIDIPEKMYHMINAGFYDYGDMNLIIQNGTPLPKGHGRLIDADKLLGSDGIIADSRKCHYIPMIDVYQAPTIIEADKEDKNE